MLQFLLSNNVHLGIELLGAIFFFIIAWLFFEDYLIKRNLFSLGRTLGFLLLGLWQIFHAISGGNNEFLNFIFLINVGGLIIILSIYGFKKPVFRPKVLIALIFLLSLGSIINRLGITQAIITSIFFLLISFILIRRYLNDDKRIKWLVSGFVFLTLSSILSILAEIGLTDIWRVLEHLVKVAGFLLIGFWGWLFLSLRIRKREASIVFVVFSLLIALLIITTFSNFLLQRIENQVGNSLKANVEILDFYIDNLKNKALVASQIIANNGDFVSAIRFKDFKDLEKIGYDLRNLTGQDFLTIAEINGDILFKVNFPIVSDENILTGEAGPEALEGRPAVTIGEGIEGFSIRAAAPIIDRGKIIGAVLTGFILDNSFANEFKDISGLETTVFIGEQMVASSLLDVKRKVTIGAEGFAGIAKFFDQEIIGLLPLKNFDGKVVGTLSLTAEPVELLKNAQIINRLNILIVFLIIIILIILLHRLTVLLITKA